MLYLYSNRQNLGKIRKRRERTALAWRPRPLGHPLSARRRALRGVGTRQLVPHARNRGRRLLLPPLPLGEDRAHAPLVARPAQDARDDRRRQREDGRLRRHGAGAQGDDLRERPLAAHGYLRRVADANGRHLQPEDPERRAATARVPPLPRPRATARATRCGLRRTGSPSCACSSSCRLRWSRRPLE